MGCDLAWWSVGVQVAAKAARARVSLACGCGVTGLEGCLAWPLQALCISVPSTILVEPGCQAEVTETGDIRVSVGAEAPSTVGAQLDPIHLSIFSHRFMSIAGEWRHCPPGPSVRCQVWGLPAGQRWAQVVRLAGLCRENVSRRGRGGSGVLAGGLALEWHGPLPQGSALPPAARALALPVDRTWAQHSEPVCAETGAQSPAMLSRVQG